MQRLTDGQKDCRTPSPGKDAAFAVMNSQQAWRRGSEAPYLTTEPYTTDRFRERRALPLVVCTLVTLQGSNGWFQSSGHTDVLD